MTQLSRPFQLALVAMGLFVLVWFVALRGHAPGSSGSSSPVAASSSSASAPASNPAAPTSIYHGKAPGMEGLTRAIDKAHGAVATSEQNAKQLREKSAQDSSQGTSAPSPRAESVTAAKPVHAVAPNVSAKIVKRPAPSASKGAGTTVAGALAPPARQVTVEKELKQGKVAVLLFWSPKGADDVAVHAELQVLLAAHHQIHALGHAAKVRKLLKVVGLELDKKIAVHYASASQIASFGSFTRTVQVYQTPTIVIVNRDGRTRTLTGLTDAFSIEQTIDEARNS